jgi:hypothetical protein
VFVLLLLILAPTSAVRGQATLDDLKIVPGERIGRLTLNMSMDDIRRLMGTPSRVEREGSSNMWEWRTSLIRVYENIDTGRVSSIRTYYVRGIHNSYRSDKGLAIGLTEGQAKQTYGTEGCLVRDSVTFREYQWAEIGVFFIISMDSADPDEIRNRVRTVGIRRPGTTPAGTGNRPCN